MRLPSPPLLIITDRSQARRPLEEIAAHCFAGGCRWLSLREKDLPAPERLALLRRLVALGRSYGAVVGVHDDIAAAVAAGAAAVHLPDGSSAREARARFTARMLIGVSAHNARGVAIAARESADYATLSPIFVSASKPDYGPALGPAALADAPLPVLALGGVDAAAIASVMAAGAAGVAVMGDVMRAFDPKRTVAELLAALATAQARRH